MFTISDICNIAVQIEQNGENAYRQAARNCANPQISEVLTWMADEEQRHGEWFKRLDLKQKASDDYREMEAMGRTLLQEMVKDQTFSLQDTSLSMAEAEDVLLTHSLEFERDTIVFYEMLLDFVEDESVSHQLDRIIQEERNHIVQLESLKSSSN